MEPVTIGLLGCGSWGGIIARAFGELPEVRLVGAADPQRERAQALAGEHPGCRAFPDPEALLYSDAIEAVFVVTPTPTHHDLVCHALEAGKHVFVEKPVALNLGEARAMAAAAERTGKALMVGQIMRFMPAVVELRRRLQAGEIGRPLHLIETRYGAFRTAAWPAWWATLEGFLLFHLGSHSVDAVLWALDRPAEWAFAQGYARQVDPAHGAIDSFALTLGLPDGLLAGIHHESTGGGGGLVYHLLAVGERGRLELEGFTTVRLNGQEVFRQEGAFNSPALQAEAREFAAAIRAGRPPAVQVHDVLPAVAALDAARASLHTGRKEPVAASGLEGGSHAA